MAELTRKGRENIRNQIENKIASPIQFFWRGNLKENQQYLQGSIQKGRTEEGNPLVFSREKVLKFLEYGTRPHLIEPDQAEALRWFNEEGEPVFAKSVKHPGTEPQASLRRAIDRVRSNT